MGNDFKMVDFKLKGVRVRSGRLGLVLQALTVRRSSYGTITHYVTRENSRDIILMAHRMNDGPSLVL